MLVLYEHMDQSLRTPKNFLTQETIIYLSESKRWDVVTSHKFVCAGYMRACAHVRWHAIVLVAAFFFLKAILSKLPAANL